MTPTPLSGPEYDAQWKELGDFIRYNPGARHRRRLCLKILDRIRAETVADIGCGPGELLLALRGTHPEIRRFVGADLAPGTVEATRQRLSWAEFRQLDITAGTLGEQFALVTCCEVIEHLADQPRALAHLAEMVAPGGHLLVTCPTGKVFATERHFGHVRHPTPQDLEQWGKDAGLRTVERYAWGYPGYLLLKRAVNIDPKMAMSQFGSGNYSTVKKLINHALYLWSFMSLGTSDRACQLVWLYQREPARP